MAAQGGWCGRACGHGCAARRSGEVWEPCASRRTARTEVCGGRALVPRRCSAAIMCWRRGVMPGLPCGVDESSRGRKQRPRTRDGLSRGDARHGITAASAAYLNMAVERTAPSGSLCLCVRWYLGTAAHRGHSAAALDERRLHRVPEHRKTYEVHGGTQPEWTDGETERLLRGGVGCALCR
jgi:hypothetical protein